MAVAAGVGAGLIVAEAKNDTRKQRLERVAVYAAMGAMVSEQMQEDETKVDEPVIAERSDGPP